MKKNTKKKTNMELAVEQLKATVQQYNRIIEFLEDWIQKYQRPKEEPRIKAGKEPTVKAEKKKDGRGGSRPRKVHRCLDCRDSNTLYTRQALEKHKVKSHGMTAGEIAGRSKETPL